MTSNVFAIDPGAKECAWVYFHGGRVALADFSVGSAAVGEPHVVVVERMQIDDRTRAIDPRYVLDCQYNGAMLAGWVAGRNGAQIVGLTPTQWKGSEQKPIQHKRMWELLDDAEQRALGGTNTEFHIDAAIEKGALRRWKISGADCYPRAWKQHNILDAAALGMTYLRRMEKR